MKGGRQAVDYRFAGGSGDPNAESAKRAAQSAFASQRSGGFQTAEKGAKVKAAIGDTIAIENTSATLADRPTVTLPKIGAGDSGKSVLVTYGLKSDTAYFRVTATEKINLLASGTIASMTLIAGTATAYQYIAIGPGYGWRVIILL